MLTLLLVLLSHKTSSYCWRTQKCRNFCLTHAFLEGQEAWGGLLKKPQSRSIEVGSPTVSDRLPETACLVAPGTLSCYGTLRDMSCDRCVQGVVFPKEVAMEVAIHLPDDIAAAVPWEDVPRHFVEQLALEGYQEGWLSEEQVRRLLGYETRLEVHGFLKEHGVYLRYTVEDLDRDRAAH